MLLSVVTNDFKTITIVSVKSLHFLAVLKVHSYVITPEELLFLCYNYRILFFSQFAT